jgi:disulfide bond formation protein DsbB
MNQARIHNIGNFIGLSFITLILLIAFLLQLKLHELPCPLCMLQRACFIGLGLGMCCNLKIGPKASHYGLIILSSILGFGIAIVQVLIHIQPGDPGYGSPFLGIHLYTWSTLFFMAVIFCCACALFFEQGFKRNTTNNKLITPIIILFLIVITANVISTFLQCGIKACPPNPTHYSLINSVV